MRRDSTTRLVSVKSGRERSKEYLAKSKEVDYPAISQRELFLPTRPPVFGGVRRPNKHPECINDSDLVRHSH